ncbi:hypothetical protein D9756_002530 [Leucocoprinus leucothites]|uniref:FAD-binding domain-containing protein n=1 Tax=Leucocoprinus leucothites TaxID=201217 RepID=A0A8H5LM17_9AGAR|nr:hypothetical protein D9756_002530 [Leucoagaricus leucothites]
MPIEDRIPGDTWTVPLPASRSLFLKPLAGRLLTLLRIPQTSLVPALSPSRRQDLSPARSPPSRRSLTLSTLRILETSGIGFMQNGDTINYLDGQMASLKVADGAPKLLIDMIVVGGGIGGLATAYALAKSGHRVQVLEKSSGLHQRAGGIRVPPNMTKILLAWGLHEMVQTALRCRKSRFHSLETGMLVGVLEWQEDIMQEAGAEFLIMHHNDLQEALYKLAVAAGATVRFRMPVQEVFFDKEKQQPSVVLQDSTKLTADVVIGADGSCSQVRKYVAPEVDVGVETNHSFYTVTVPTSEMQKDPELSEFASLHEWPIWMGNSRSAFGKSTVLSLLRHSENPQLRHCEQVEEGWDVTVPTSIINFRGCDPRIQRLFNISDSALRTKVVHRQIAEDWLDDSGSILLVGEAAHPLMPCTMQGPSLAMEDAAVLGKLMSHLSTREQIPQLLEAFPEVRHTRCLQVHGSESRNAMLVTLPPGEDRDRRDAGMSLSLRTDTTWDDTMLREQWEEIGDVFGYNAHEAAEDWWMKWGALVRPADY